MHITNNTCHGYPFFDKFISRIIYYTYTSESKKTYIFLFIALIGLVSIFSVLQFFSRLSPIWAPWDVFVLLNGGWRMFNGQIPHVDFSTPNGILSYIPVYIGMEIGGISSASLVRGTIIFGILFSLAAWIVAKKRLSAIFTFLISFFLFILTISTRPLGYGTINTTYAMIYNRYGYAIFSLLIILLFIPHRFPRKSTIFFDGLLSGILLGLLLYCKVTYFIAGCVMILLYITLHRITYEWIIMNILGFSLVVIGMLVLFHLNPLAYFIDINTAAQSQSLVNRLKNLLRVVKNHLLQIFIVYSILLFYVIPVRRSNRIKTDFIGILKPGLIVTFLVGSGVFLSSGNTGEKSDIPIFFLCGLIIFYYYTQKFKTEVLQSKASIAQLMIILIGTFILIGQIFVKDATSLIYTILWNKTDGKRIPSSQIFHSNSLSDFIIPSNSTWRTAYWIANNVPQRINEGLDLLRPYINKDTQIFCFCLTDPFSFGLGIQPAIGTPLWWDKNQSFDDDTYPNPEALFGNINLVIVPEFHEDDGGCCKETVFLMEEKYKGYLDQHFLLNTRSEHWLLYEKR